MHAQDYSGEHKPDLQRLLKRYETQLQEGQVAFLELDHFLILIDHYESNNQLEQALRILQFAIQQHPFSAILYVRKAQCLTETERYQEALEILETAKTYEPSNIDIYLAQTDVYTRLEDLSAVLESIREGKAHSNPNPDEMAELYVMLANVYEAKKEYAKALKYFRKTLRQRPDHLLALSRLWTCYEQTEQYQEAVDFLTTLIERAPYAYWAWYTLGLAYRYLDQRREAAEAFDFAIVSNEQFEPAYWHCIDCLLELGNMGEALDYLERNREAFGENADLWFRYGQAYEYEGNYARARHYYGKALQYHSMNGRIYYAIGHCHLEEEAWRRAEQAFLEAYSVDKSNEEFCLALADTYDVLGEIEQAHEFYHRAISLGPNLVRTWLHYFEFLIDEDSHAVALEMVGEARGHVDGVLLDYAEAAILLDSGQRQEGFILLGQALIADFSLCRYLFRLAPNLEHDAQLHRFISDYQVDDHLEEAEEG